MSANTVQVWKMLSRTLLKILPISLAAFLCIFQPVILYAEDAVDTQETASFVPSLSGKTLSEVQALLPQYDLTLGSVTEEESDLAAGTIISQDQQPNTNIPRFSAVNITIAIPRQATTAIAVPEVVNPGASAETTQETRVITEESPAISPESQKPIAEAPQIVEKNQVSEITPPVEEIEKKANVAIEIATEEPATEVVTEQEPKIKNVATEKVEEDKAESQSVSSIYNGRKLTFTVEPEGYIQVSREITMEMKLTPPANSDSMQYQFNISGKPYNSASPVFTHVFDEEETVILTASARLPGKPWLHSASKRIKIGKYVPRKIKVPKITGLTESKAVALLKSKGLEVGNTRDKIVKGKNGIILEQMPKAGTIRTEDDNKIHYVKAVDEKFKVQLLAKKEGLETGSSINITARVQPKPPASKTRYSFEVNGETHNSKSPKWQYVFNEAGQQKVIAKAIINGEGTFESEPFTLNIVDAWKKPTAVISPYTLTIEAGESVKFASASAYDTRGEVKLAWSDEAGNTSNTAEFLVNTEGLSVGEHVVTLSIKDERGNESTANAQLIITAKAETSTPTTTAEEDSSQESDTQTVEETPENDAEAPSSNSPVDSEVKEDTTTETVNETEPVNDDATVAEIPQDSDEQARNNPTTDSTEIESSESSANIINNDKDMFHWGTWIWLLMIAIVLLPILFIIKKLHTQTTAKKQTTVTASPYGHEGTKQQTAKVVSSSDNRFANLSKTSTPSKPTAKVKSAPKKSAKPDLVDFDLDVKPANSKSKKDELTDFKLDD